MLLQPRVKSTAFAAQDLPDGGHRPGSVALPDQGHQLENGFGKREGHTLGEHAVAGEGIGHLDAIDRPASRRADLRHHLGGGQGLGARQYIDLALVPGRGERGDSDCADIARIDGSGLAVAGEMEDLVP